MARYRKIDVRIWNDRKFRELDDKAKLAFFLVLTHPDTNQLGMLRSRSVALAMELGWHPDVMSDAMLTLCRMGMLMVDDKAGFIFIPNFLKYNPPNGPNSVKGWSGLLDQMPECALLNHAISCLKPFICGLSEGLQNAIPDDIKDAISHAIPDDIKDAHRIQEQEQEQKQKNTNKQLSNIEGMEPSDSEDSCSEDFSDSIADQAENLAIDETMKVVDDPDAIVTPVQVIGLAKNHGIRLYRSEKLNDACSRKILTVDNVRQCIRIAKKDNKGGPYLVGILANAVNEPNEYHTWEYEQKKRKEWEDGVDENVPF